VRYIVATLILMNLGYFVYHWPVRGVPFGFAEPTTTASESVAVVVGTPGVKRIRLLREVRGDASRERQLNRVIKNPLQQGMIDVLADPREQSSGEELCQAFGPLDDLFTGQALVEKLKLYDMQTILQAVDQATGDSDYRIVIPPAKSPQDAFRKLRELKSANIDSYVITQGPDALGISLGLFSSQSGAQNASADLAADGYVTQVREIPRLLREFWVYGMTNNERLTVDAVIWEAILIEYPEIEQKMRLCLENNSSEV
jgi:hypothetical protein